MILDKETCLYACVRRCDMMAAMSSYDEYLDFVSLLVQQLENGLVAYTALTKLPAEIKLIQRGRCISIQHYEAAIGVKISDDATLVRSSAWPCRWFDGAVMIFR